MDSESQFLTMACVCRSLSKQRGYEYSTPGQTHAHKHRSKTKERFDFLERPKSQYCILRCTTEELAAKRQYYDTVHQCQLHDLVYSIVRQGKTGAWRGHCCRGTTYNVLHILSVCLQPWLSSIESACAVLNSHLWSVLLYNIFPHYLTNDTVFGKKL
jgi:hypothetical protein